MARIRTIKPEFYTDGDMLKLSIPARFFYIGLWNFADDNGVIEYDTTSLKARIFPVDRVKVDQLLEELTNIKKIVVYDVENKRYLLVKNLVNHQVIDRPRKSNLPLPQDNQLKSIEINHVRKEGKEGREHFTQEFFEYFLLKTKKAFKLTDTVKDLINKKFSEGYTIQQMKLAADNFMLDTWEGRKEHLDIIYCIGKQKGKPDNLEKWLNYKPQQPSRSTM